MLAGLVLLPALLGGAAATAADDPSVTIKDETRGIFFKAPRRWVPIPVDPTEALVIYKFQADRADTAKRIRARNTASLEVLFFPKRSDPDPPPPGESASPEPKAEPEPEPPSGGEEEDPPSGEEEEPEPLTPEAIRAARARIPADYETYTAKLLAGYEREDVVERTVRGIPATFYSFVGPTAATGNTPTLRVSSALFSAEDGQYVMQFVCLEDHYRSRHRADFESAFRSFKRIDRSEDAAGGADLDDNERYIQEQIARLPAGWYWFWSRSGRFVIFCNAERAFARKIEDSLEKIHDCFAALFPGDPRVDWKPIVRVCRTRDEYVGYGGPAGSAGYWSDLTKEFVFYDDVAGGERNSMTTLRHEAFHHFIHFRSGCRPSTWFDEGHADYFGGGDLAGRLFKPAVNAGRRGAIQSALVSGRHIPLYRFVRLTQQEYYAQAGLCYAQGWSFIYFLREGRRNGARTKKEWEAIPDLYLKHLDEALAALEAAEPDKAAAPGEVNWELSDEAARLATERTFDGWTADDWRELEEAWSEFTR